MQQLIDRARRDERGAVLVIVAIAMTVLIGAGAFAVDAGAAWTAQRRLRTATDAAALAAGNEYANGGNGCATADDTLTTANDPGATVTACTFVGVAGTGFNLIPGRVSVTAERTVDYVFAPIMGVDDVEIHSSTTTRWGTPKAAFGLRPMGLCINANPLLTAWFNLPGGGPLSDSGTIRIMYNKDHPDACGSNAPGNWGMMDFNGGSNSNAETKAWVLNGYPGDVPLSPPRIPGDTGAFSNSISSELTTLIDEEFALPVFDDVTGNGSNASYRVVAFVKVVLVGFKTTGSEGSRYLDLVFKKGVLPGGRCCGSGTNTGALAVGICAVDESFDTADCGPG